MAATPPAEPANTAPPPTTSALPSQPGLSTDDDGLSRRPRDARLLHLVLSSLGIHSYQERVPLQLLDFAYRYTSAILSDSLRLSAEGYTSAAVPNRRGAAHTADPGDGSNVTVSALRQAIASRMDNSFVPALPKEWMLEQAQERNRTMLPKVEKGFGMQLPPERFVLTGTPWGLEEEWDSEGEEGEGEKKVNGATDKGDETMGGMEEEEGEGGFEDVFGEGEMKDA
ncbi:hypothetical protein CAC42_7032 [Sphaceloma murrayae]|uniref:Transcription initiation factor TFIID subunit 9 n=1 Tax=Sphaceloma murrayae TaxID=2082308 RepID=A0A2K1QQT9_9PEZI|nr:hypothetical protein CAC42_7032 [Sphaceloma murrayae]